MAECGAEAGACRVEEGQYQIVLPDPAGAEGAVPLVMFLHGYGGSGSSVLDNRSLVEGLTEQRLCGDRA
ncbi:hypothetical protein [Leisingera sp. ANG59]|uniref:hypothetical protein n=1 Tax=Leisingera sp. ANG59 TaxID=2675221 RepID=UPI0020C5FB6D|nr:hypothetical protein [Leisingera sp. ANG59]